MAPAYDWSGTRNSRGRVILAGSLIPKMSAKRFSEPEPWAVDVASGVESSPGRKDHARMKKFIEEALRLMTSQPDAGGHFGTYGGRYVPEVLMSPLEELEQHLRGGAQGPGVP